MFCMSSGQGHAYMQLYLHSAAHINGACMHARACLLLMQVGMCTCTHSPTTSAARFWTAQCPVVVCGQELGTLDLNKTTETMLGALALISSLEIVIGTQAKQAMDVQWRDSICEFVHSASNSRQSAMHFFPRKWDNLVTPHLKIRLIS